MYDRTHGMKGTPEYKAYYNAKERCTNPHYWYWRRYGGRGIEFRFASFAEFFAELGPRPSPEHSVDRKENDGHYEKGNVRWATRSEQEKNKHHQRKEKVAKVKLTRERLLEIRRENARRAHELNPDLREASRRGGLKSGHVRCHVRRGIVNPNCEFCSQEAVAA